MRKNAWFGFNKPAAAWEEALPLGNGSFGAMVYGSVDTELIQLNQESVWSCGPRERMNPDAKDALPEVRKLVFEGNLKKAEEEIYTKMLADPLTLGHYEPLGEVRLVFDKRIPHYSELFAPKQEKAENYSRTLDMEKALYACSFEKNGIHQEREAFISYPDQIMALHIQTSAPIGMRLEMSRGDAFDTMEATADTLLMTGQPGGGAPVFACMTKVVSDGSQKRTGSYIDVENAENIWIYLAGRTSYYHDDLYGADHGFIGKEDRMMPVEWCTQKLNAAVKKGYEAVKTDHIRDVCQLFNRVELDLNEEDQQPLSAERFYNYGRYLTIASSRPGSLPSNLQGIWNKDYNPSWGSRYTININLQMNYWLAESANLPECHLPLMELIHRMIPQGKKIAEEMYGCRGAVAHHNTDIYGDCAPNEHWMPASLWPMGLGWLGTHIVEHYRYTKDLKFAETWLPDLKEIVSFYLDYLIPDANGNLVTCPSTSPENTYLLPNGQKSTVCYGPAMDAQIIRELWQGYLEMTEEYLKERCPEEKCPEKSYPEEKYPEQKYPEKERPGHMDAGMKYTREEQCKELREIAGEIKDKLSLLPENRIGSRGQLLEWQEEYTEWEKGHRHISHLYALYPGHQIAPDTPELFQAAERTLGERLTNGGGGTGWSRSWVINFQARLGKGNEAAESLWDLLKEQTAPNLFDLHPPLGPGMKTVFQIDGNFGGPAGITEMLVQTRGEEIHFLPALPDCWPKGHVKGIRCPGGREVEFSWENGKLTGSSVRKPV